MSESERDGYGLNGPYPHQVPLRKELPPLPESMQRLPLHRGYPVPWFVEWIDGEPDFRVTSARKIVQTAKQRLCWVCGSPITEKHFAFLIGPMCAVNRVSSEPPSHIECAEFSAKGCPFMSRPHMVRREAGMPEDVSSRGLPIKRNPGVGLVWVTKSYSAFPDQHGRALFRVGDPTRVTCYAEGRLATKAEIRASVDSGIPILRETAGTYDGPEGLAALAAMEKRARKILGLPAAKESQP